jgi:hypothetical protein
MDENRPRRLRALSHPAPDGVGQTSAEDPSPAQSPGQPELADADAGQEDDGWVPA